MSHEANNPKRDAAASDQPPPFFSSNGIRLSFRQWCLVFVVVLAVVIATPWVWTRVEPFDPPIDYRLPYVLSEDYWLYEQRVSHAVEQNQIIVIGDSVVWGEYVGPDATLSHFLNEESSSTRFVNGGVNGIHPLALQGLVGHHTPDLVDQHVIVHCNLLWMSSQDRDLQTDKEVSFNHPRLVPQFSPRIPCYKASKSERLSIVVDRTSRFRGWVSHLRIAYFDNLDLHNWTIEHPQENPLEFVTGKLPQPSETLRHRSVPWNERGIKRQDIPWVDFDTSLQWHGFQNLVEDLRVRGNRVVVVVGPFNEHMLTDSSRQRFWQRKQTVADWLQTKDLPHLIPAPLPSHEYGDASHPLRDGYARLAKSILENSGIQHWLGDR